jgi:tRNA U34 5-carboxymethylaminomethyl modifying GTPase MnmE/TrmE
MKSAILDQDLQPIRLRLEEIVKQLQQMAQRSHDENLAQIVSDLRSTVNEPFLFVIVGEVKTGKSSFINALLATGKDVVKVAPDPCTDTVQQVVYGKAQEEVVINPYHKKIYQPAEILRHISVVDTPGTNTIEERHQEITEGYIPRSDLIVFVFEAKNPYRQSAWQFFDYIHSDWKKKVIFVLQQADLMDPPDLAINQKGIMDYAKKKGLPDPKVFTVSAKLELQGQDEASGFKPLNQYIREHITGRNAYRLKLQSSIGTVRNVQARIGINLGKMQAQLQTDRAFRRDVRETLSAQEERSYRQIDKLIQGLLRDYDQIAEKAQQELREGLGIGPMAGKLVRSIFKRADSPAKWLNSITDKLKADMERRVNRRLNEGVEEIAEAINQMARIIDLKIKQNQATLKGPEAVFGEISDQRRAVIQDLRDDFDSFVNEAENFMGTEVLPETSRISPNVLTGSGVAVIGAVLTAATHIPLLDITGGVLSALGLAVAGGTVMVKRGKLIKGFAQEIDKGRRLLAEELDEKLKTYVGHIRQQIESNFQEFDDLLKTEDQHIDLLTQQQQDITTQLTEMDKKLGA